MNVNLELRKLSEQVKEGSIKVADAQPKFEQLRAEKKNLEQEMAQRSAPMEKRSLGLADIQNAMMEKRSITLNGTGAINQIKELVKGLSAKKNILNDIRFFYGANASTNIPVLNPTVATPAAQNEGATEIDADTTAVLSAKSITPKAYVSILPVSAEALALGSIDIENELAGIFADAFADAFAKGVIAGDGTFTGLFTPGTNVRKVKCGATGAPKIEDIVNLALTVKDFADDAVIVMSPTIYSAVLADATEGVSPIYKEELIRNKTVEGVRVELTSYAPSTYVADDYVAVAGRLSDFGIGVASEVIIEPIKVKGDTNTYFQAMVFANGTRIVDANFHALQAV